MLALVLTLFQVCAAVSLATAPWIFVRQRRRVDDLSSFSSWVAALPGMVLFVVLLAPDWFSSPWAWPLWVLGPVWYLFWIFGGPYLLRLAVSQRRSGRWPRVLGVLQLFHACCWLTTTALPLVAALDDGARAALSPAIEEPK